MNARVATVPTLSVTATVNWKVPGEVAVPDSVPPLNDVPEGIEPVTPNVYGGTPPDAPNCALTGDPTVPSVGAPVTKSGGARIVTS